MDRRGLAIALACGALLAVAGAGLVGGQESVGGEPRLDVYVPDPSFQPGTDDTLELDITNDGQIRFGTTANRDTVTTARNVRVDVDADDAPIDVHTGQRAIGPVTESEPRTAPFEITVPDDAEPSVYEIDVELRYSHTAQQFPTGGVENEVSRTVTRTVEIEIDDGPRFAIVDAETEAQVGGDGDLQVTLENVGDDPAREASVSASTTGSEVRIGEDGTAESFVGGWEPGEQRTVSFDTRVGSGFAGGSYPLETKVTYRTTQGVERESLPARTGVRPIGKQEFSLDGVEGTLEVGYAGTIGGTLTNDGPRTVDDGVLYVEPASDRVHVEERQYALPELDPDESVEFSFDADVSGQADPGPRQVRFTVEYTSGDGPIEVQETSRIEVQSRQPEFDLAVADNRVPAGESRQLEVTITNNRPETLSSINANMYADSPLSATDDEAFVGELAPGESTDLLFEVTADGSATPKDHPIEFDFRYDDGRGDDRISDVTQVPITVTEPEGDDGGLPWLPIAIVLLAIGLLAWYQRDDLPRSRDDLPFGREG